MAGTAISQNGIFRTKPVQTCQNPEIDLNLIILRKMVYFTPFCTSLVVISTGPINGPLSIYAWLVPMLNAISIYGIWALPDPSQNPSEMAQNGLF